MCNKSINDEKIAQGASFLGSSYGYLNSVLKNKLPPTRTLDVYQKYINRTKIYPLTFTSFLFQYWHKKNSTDMYESLAYASANIGISTGLGLFSPAAGLGYSIIQPFLPKSVDLIDSGSRFIGEKGAPYLQQLHNFADKGLKRMESSSLSGPLFFPAL
ncbi:hypothetical protein [Salinivibrio sp. YCSC6]|uniref:hypothetical protein n=1 Tax=Salinivibrio sp. YCSC6 TaxID=2003370 RepID=UPI0010A7B4E7|nr:hypothetical protein [Salinivibrio sp. YCSC6]QCF37673.1 hypothetical protein E8E00_15870 [Salinivibrio sp. YCSC6]